MIDLVDYDNNDDSDSNNFKKEDDKKDVKYNEEEEIVSSSEEENLEKEANESNSSFPFFLHSNSILFNMLRNTNSPCQKGMGHVLQNSSL